MNSNLPKTSLTKYQSARRNNLEHFNHKGVANCHNLNLLIRSKDAELNENQIYFFNLRFLNPGSRPELRSPEPFSGS